MRSERLARTLLWLYPRAWRLRYGDEFLALIADGGLTWREVVDVIGAAGVERVRAAVALIRSELDPTAQSTEVPVADGFRETALFAALASATVFVLSFAGVPLPRWTWWPFLVIQSNSFVLTTTRAQTRWSERAWLSFFWFAGIAGLTGVCWLVAGVLSWFGVPMLTDRTFYTVTGPFLLAALLRGIYCCIRILVYGSTWPGIHSREFLAWRLGILTVAGLTANVDPAGEVFWSIAMLVGMAFRTPYELTRHGAARRRAQHEEIERAWTK